jgi:solute carrier family 25 citrate transporter 1
MQLNKNQNAIGFANVIKATVKSNGFVSLYRGYSAMLMFCVPKNSVRFGTYDYVSKNVFTSKSTASNFVCGLSAGAMEAIFVVTPQETLKIRLVHDKL